MIPEEKNEAVVRGLQAAFGLNEYEELQPLTKGHQHALVFRMTVQGKDYVLRVNMRPNKLVDPARESICMKLAAEAGIAPRIWYLNVEDGVTITEFVNEKPFDVAEASEHMPDVLRRLHALPAFPEPVQSFNTSCTFLLHNAQAVEGFLQKIAGAQLMTVEDKEAFAFWYAQVTAAYREAELDKVSSHNDLFKPDNILFDGERVWLVDWEAAFLNDRYADLAVMTLLLTESEEDERAFLEAYLERPATENEHARLYVMQQAAHMFYTLAFLLPATFGDPVKIDANAQDFRALQRRFWAGEVRLDDTVTKAVYSTAHLNQLQKNALGARWERALAVVAGR